MTKSYGALAPAVLDRRNLSPQRRTQTNARSNRSAHQIMSKSRNKHQSATQYNTSTLHKTQKKHIDYTTKDENCEQPPVAKMPTLPLVGHHRTHCGNTKEKRQQPFLEEHYSNTPHNHNCESKRNREDTSNNLSYNSTNYARSCTRTIRTWN